MRHLSLPHTIPTLDKDASWAYIVPSVDHRDRVRITYGGASRTGLLVKQTEEAMIERIDLILQLERAYDLQCRDGDDVGVPRGRGHS